MSYLPGKFVWFEHLSNDVPSARKFYEVLFGWHTESMPMGDHAYSMIQNGGDAIGGYGDAPPGVPSCWMSYLSVADVDAAYTKATAAGAKGLMAPMDYGSVGRCGVIKDPTGAAVSLWKGAQGDRADVARTAVGDWHWNELVTQDTAAALAFYESVFGFTHDSMDMGPMGTYYLLKAGATMRGGMMKCPDPAAPSMWLPYVAVADCDASAAKATALGAQVVVAPKDIPSVGRFAVFADPLGAALAIMKPAPAAG